jgi:hypothetical protein
MNTMSIREVPRLIFELPLDAPDAGDAEGFALAIGPHGAVTVQLAFGDARLRTFSEACPPSCTMPCEAAIEMAREILAQLRPDLAAKLDATERPLLRLVGSEDPEAA